MAASKIKFGGAFGGKTPSQSKLKKIVYPEGKPNLERDADIELTELQKDFKEAARKETQMKEDNTNCEFFSVLVFKTMAQRDEFLKLLSIKEYDNQYVSGEKLIKALELQIEKVNLKDPGKFKCNKEILNLAMQL